MRYAWIEQNRDHYSISRLCRLLSVSRSGYCQWRVRPPSSRVEDNAVLDARIEVIYRQSKGSYGRPRIIQALRHQGLRVGGERVRRSLLRQGLRPAYRRAYRATTDSNHTLPVARNVLQRRFDGWQPNQAWLADITYVATAQGWLYLAAVLDLSSRRIVGWSMSERIDTALVCQALKSAYWQRKPASGLILHTDRGSQYASHIHQKMVSQYGFVMSMSRKANAWDNAPMESFFKTLKVERLYRVHYYDRQQARLDIVDWIEGFYNRQRLHSSNGFQTPVVAEAMLKAA